MKNKHELMGPYRKKILLVQPSFPLPNKRKIHHDFFPIGLLKIGTYLKQERKCTVELTFDNKPSLFRPDEIWITSLFTYWSSYVHDSIEYYQSLYPNTPIYLGGIYATLLSEVINIPGVIVQKGVYSPAEEYSKTHFVDEKLLKEPLDFQIIHSMRGCFRKCKFCGTWKIEPEETYTDNIPNMIRKNHVIFYDNNLLRRPDIEKFLYDLSRVKVNGKYVTYESQSGFDGRILNQDVANLLHKAHFINVRIAWDGGVSDYPDIEKQIQYLCKAGYKRKEIFVFMLMNWDIVPAEMEKKRQYCWRYGVQIIDCRFRPLNQLYGHYSTKIKQTDIDYYIHPSWSDSTIKRFRRNIRKHNICIRHEIAFYSVSLERKKINQEKSKEMKTLKDKKIIMEKIPDAWFPDEDHMYDLINI